MKGNVGPPDAAGIPANIGDYTRLTLSDIIPILDSQLAGLEFGDPPLTVKIKSLREAAQLQQRYVYNEQKDAITDQITGVVYPADDFSGQWTDADGSSLNPGFQVNVGFANFKRLFGSPALTGPFVQIFIWTLVFAVISVASTFALGLFLALVYNDPTMRYRKIIRTLLILPYAIPGVIGILIWRARLTSTSA